MTTMTGKEVLAALANGADPTHYQWRSSPSQAWVGVTYETPLDLMLSGSLAFRSTPVAINGFDVPAPQRGALKYDEAFYVADPTSDRFVIEATWDGSAYDLMWLKRGLVYLRREDAVAAAKAMLSLDPAQGA